jgi:hypothetical protein
VVDLSFFTRPFKEAADAGDGRENVFANILQRAAFSKFESRSSSWSYQLGTRATFGEHVVYEAIASSDSRFQRRS